MASDLPAIVSPLPNDVRNFLQRVREMLVQSGNYRFVTVADLLNGNIGALSASGSLYTASTESYDFTPPPAPANLVAVGALATILLQWDAPVYAKHAHTEVWRASVDNLGVAAMIGAAQGVMYADSVDAQSSYYYWVRFISQASIEGPFNAISGVLGTTSADPSAMLEILANQITASELSSALNSRINLIDAPATGLVAQVGALAAQTIPAINEQTDALAFAINELSLQASAAQQKLLFSKAITDATITVDPATGTITLTAVEALKNGSSITLNTVETTLNAHDASIISNASAISSVDGRVTSAESTITQHSSDILLRATITELNDVAAAILAGFTPAYTWAFNGTVESWTANAATLTAYSYDMEVAETGAGAYIESPAISVDGSIDSLIYIKLDKKAGTGWTGKVQYQTAGHGYSDSHYKAFAQPTWDATYKLLALDMTTLTAGGDDWATGTITGVRIFIGAGSGDITDIDTIEIGKSQIDQMLTADLNARLGEAEISISANTAAIALKASQTTVTGHEARLTSAEADVDANAAAIALKAASTTVSAIDARLGAAEIDIDANTASISSKASQITVDAIDTRVSTAESTLDANAGSITLVTMQAQEATSNVNAVGDSLLSALVGLDNTLGRDRVSSYGVATAMLEITSAVNALGAEAAARLLLEAAYQSTAAALSSDYYTRAAADAAVASYTASMSAAAFKQRIYPQPAAPTDITLFVGDVWIDTDNNFAISYWDGTAWQLSQDTRIASNTAAITAEQTVRADADSAAASSISTLQSSVSTAQTAANTAQSAANTAIANSAIAQTTADTAVSASTANANSINQVSARLDTGDFADVEVSAAASASTLYGMSGEYTVKMSVNGKVVGYGISTGGTTGSKFIASVDTFAVQIPDSSITPWSASLTVALGRCIGISGNTAKMLVCRQAGTTGSSEPSIAGAIGTLITTDGSVIWQIASRVPLYVAAAEQTIDGVTVYPGVYFDGAMIVNATINNAQIANLAVDNAKIASMSVNKLTAGELNIGAYIRHGQTAYNVGTGFFLGDGGGDVPKFSLGVQDGAGLTWDGTSLSLTGMFTAAAVNAVNTINLAGNAVTVPEYVTGSYWGRFSSTLRVYVMTTSASLMANFVAGVATPKTVTAHLYVDYAETGANDSYGYVSIYRMTASELAQLTSSNWNNPPGTLVSSSGERTTCVPTNYTYAKRMHSITVSFKDTMAGATDGVGFYYVAILAFKAASDPGMPLVSTFIITSIGTKR